MHYIPINNERFLVYSCFFPIIINSKALWISYLTEEPNVVKANSPGAERSGAQTAERWAGLQIADIAQAR